MTDSIVHRGPNAGGAFVDPRGNAYLGHRRLSILDLSASGAQPMWSRDQRWCIVFNGEIYNFEQIRTELEAERGAVAWRGHSDTEVLIEAIALWGVQPAVERCNGMFAIAVWDQAKQVLTLARDRMGEKPLYYGWQDGVLLFGSELKALMAHPACGRRLDRNALAQYLSFSFVPSGCSILQGITKLPPASLVSIDISGDGQPAPVEWAYWRCPMPQPREIGAEDACAQLRSLLTDAVRLRMRADVPMGAFLSGGIDSSAIVGLMQACAAEPVRTFSIGFVEQQFNEAVYAADVARHLGTRHTELTVTAQDALDLVPQLPRLYDEPFADSSQIPTYLLARLSRQSVTVSLSGDGGDEVFCGYTRYFTFNALWSRLRHVSPPLRAAMGGALRLAPDWFWRVLAKAPLPLLRAITPHRVQKLAEVFAARGAHEFYRGLVTFWDPAALLREPVKPLSLAFDRYRIDRDYADPMLGMSHVDTLTYLPDDILVKVDRATMAASLEGRIPFLDHRLVEFAATLPATLKVRDGVGKWLLRQVLAEYVPTSFTDRPKQGFGIPVSDWLRGPLRAWADDLLGDDGTAVARCLDLAPVRRVWSEHRSGQDSQAHRLWILLILQAWSREWRISA